MLVRDVPEDVHTALQRRAEQRGQSLQQYLVTELSRLATRPTVAEVLAQVDELDGGHVGLATAVADLNAERSAS